MASAAAQPPPTSATASSTPNNASTLRANVEYLVRGKKSAVLPGSLRTRSTLATIRYVGKFVFWRLVRYFKYAIVAAGVAALAGTTLGAAVPWAMAIAVPSVPVAAAIGLTTATIKFGWRHRGDRFRQGWLAGGEGRDAREDERRDAEDAANEFSKPTVNPRAERAWGFAA